MHPKFEITNQVLNYNNLILNRSLVVFMSCTGVMYISNWYILYSYQFICTRILYTPYMTSSSLILCEWQLRLF